MNGTAPYSKLTITPSGSKSLGVMTSYLTSSCSGTGTPSGNTTISSTCTKAGSNNGNPTYQTVATATAITAPSSTFPITNQIFWSSQAACTAGTITSGAFLSYYGIQNTANSCSGNYPSNNICPSAFTSISGGFRVMKIYTSAGCSGTPVNINAYQMGVCRNNTGNNNRLYSNMYVPWTNGKGFTQFNQTQWTGSATCTKGTNVQVYSYTTNDNTTSCKQLVGRQAQNYGYNGGKYYTMSLQNTVGFTAGTGSAQYSTTAACLAGGTSAIASLYPGPSTACTATSSASTTYYSTSLSSCPAVVNTPATLYAATR